MKRALLPSAACIAMLALVVPLATANHRAGHGKGDGQANPNLSIGAEPNPVRIGKTVTISGKLKGTDNANKTLELQSDEFPFNGQFRRVGEHTATDANGDYSFQVTPDLHTNYRVSELPSGDFSETIQVRVKMRITRTVDDTTPTSGQTVTFSGVVTPEHDGNTVLIQRRRATGTWRTWATATLQAAPGDQSTYSQGVVVKRDGIWRTKVRADDDHLGNKSRRIRLDVP